MEVFLTRISYSLFKPILEPENLPNGYSSSFDLGDKDLNPLEGISIPIGVRKDESVSHKEVVHLE